MLFQTTTMVSRLENFKFLNYNNGLRSEVKLYTHLMNLWFVKNILPYFPAYKNMYLKAKEMSLVKVIVLLQTNNGVNTNIKVD